MLAISVRTILLRLRSRFIGSGYLVAAGFTGIFLGPSPFASRLRGVALMMGMTLVAGAIQFAIAPLLRRLRPLLPPEIAGLVIAVIGFSFPMAVIANIYRDVLASVPQVLKPIFDHSLVLATVCAVLLILIMRIGVRRRVSLTEQRLAGYPSPIWGSRRQSRPRCGSRNSASRMSSAR
jgi:xanthine/uracil permease